MPRRPPVPDIRFGRLSKSGRGFSLAVPKDILKQMGWTYGTTLEFWIAGQVLCLSRARTARDAIQAGEDATDATLPGPEGTP